MKCPICARRPADRGGWCAPCVNAGTDEVPGDWGDFANAVMLAQWAARRARSSAAKLKTKEGK